MALSDSSAKVVQRYEYDSFGNRKDMQNTIKQPYAYTAREWDKEIWLYFYSARYYDPMEGRFISEDPIGFAGGDVNMYRYVQGNPVNWIDSYGYIQTQPPHNATLDPGQINRSYEYEPHAEAPLKTPEGSYGQFPFLPDIKGFDSDKLNKLGSDVKDIFQDKKNPSCGGGANMRHELMP